VIKSLKKVKIAEKCRAGESNTPKKVARERKERQREGGGGVCARERRGEEPRSESVFLLLPLPNEERAPESQGLLAGEARLPPPLVSSSQSHLIPYYYY
jgi:hypothetical protein